VVALLFLLVQKGTRTASCVPNINQIKDLGCLCKRARLRAPTVLLVISPLSSRSFVFLKALTLGALRAPIKLSFASLRELFLERHFIRFFKQRNNNIFYTRNIVLNKFKPLPMREDKPPRRKKGNKRRFGRVKREIS